MKTLAIFFVVFNFLTGSLNTVKDNLWKTLENPQQYPFRTLAAAFNTPEPIRNISYKDPIISASAGIVLDAATGKILFEKNAHQRLPMASITKIMSALVVLRYNSNLQTVVRVSEKAANTTGSNMRLYAGEELTVEDLLKGMLIASANDAAYTLSESTAGTEENFVDIMNKYANELQLLNTHFTNCYGADAEDHFSSAYDLAKLTAYALQDPVFASILKMDSATVKNVQGTATHKLQTTNKLVGKYANILGGKTGTTSMAGASLVEAAQGPDDQTVIAVLLDSPGRFNESKTLLDWSLRAYSWIRPL